MYLLDAEKIAFMTDMGIYYYLALPFGMKNEGETFQQIINKMFKNQITRTMKGYIDEMVAKSKNASDHIRDLVETFDILQIYNMNLNPIKCNFTV